jgi:hypothetical protein
VSDAAPQLPQTGHSRMAQHFPTFIVGQQTNPTSIGECDIQHHIKYLDDGWWHFVALKPN